MNNFGLSQPFRRVPRLLARAIAPIGLLLAVAVVAPRAATQAVTENADVSHFTLANGLEVVVIPDHRVPVVTHMVWYKVGSADEPSGKSGIAHFLEHLMFKGTEKYPGGFSQEVVELGA